MNPLILIAEDDADIRGLLKLYLEGEGFRVLEADNGARALDLARVKAQLRRSSRSGSDILTVRELTLDTTTFQLTKNGKQILLTPMEYKILALLMRSPGRIYTKIQLYEGAIGNYFEGDDNTMMVHISKLRDKIEDDPKSPRYIITVRGLGYKLEK